jgi:hypothetical protein
VFIYVFIFRWNHIFLFILVPVPCLLYRMVQLTFKINSIKINSCHHIIKQYTYIVGCVSGGFEHMTFPTYSMFLPLKRKPHPSYMSYDLIDMCEKYGKSNVSTKSWQEPLRELRERNQIEMFQ